MLTFTFKMLITYRSAHFTASNDCCTMSTKTAIESILRYLPLILVISSMQISVLSGYRAYRLRKCFFSHSFNLAALKSDCETGNVEKTIRIPANNISLDISLISQNPELVRSHLLGRRSDSSLMDNLTKIGELRLIRNNLIFEGDSAKSLRKSLSSEIGKLIQDKKLDDAEILKSRVEEANKKAAIIDVKLNTIEQELQSLLAYLPNLLDDKVPDGSSDADNVVIHSWGDDLRKIGPNYMWHDEIASKLGGLSMDAASRISGARFSVLTGALAKLERALVQYFLDFHTSRGYIEVSVPYIVSRSTLQGTGQLPKFEDDLFRVNHNVSNEDAFLIPTSEVPVTNLYRDQVIDMSILPIKHVCYSPCFRAEAGSYGRDTRGLLRQHQFHKVELVKITTPESSSVEHDAMTNDAEDILRSLELPFRRMLLCSGDIGFSARICYDLEVWLPGQQSYREISSVSNCYDFQSRRMSLRYKNSKDKKKGSIYPHTLNGSGVAVGR